MKKNVGFFPLAFCFVLAFILPSCPLEAKEDKKPVVKMYAPAPNQPYPHQWFETKTKKGKSVVGQAYRPRKDLVVLEMIPLSNSGAPVEIKSVRLVAPNGKVYEGQVRHLPFGFMPIARQNYQQPEGSAEPRYAASPDESK